MSKIYLLILFIPFFLFFSFKFSRLIKIYDYPDNKRKIHSKPILLVGGIFFELIIIFYYFIILLLDKFDVIHLYVDSQKDYLILLFTLSLCFFVGIYDDKKNLNAFFKLIIMFIIFFVSLTYLSDIYQIKKLSSFFGYELFLNFYSIFFTSLCFVILLNAANMADGINSLSCNTFLIWLFLINFFLPLDNFYFFMNIILIISLILFSILNYKNKCFLGDGGCFVLVSYISFVTVYTYNLNSTNQIQYLNLESIFLLFLIPGIDMLRLFLKRSIRGQNPLKADKDHLHHIMIAKYGNLKTLIIYNALTLFPRLIYLVLTSLLPYLIIIVIVIYYLLVSKIKKPYEKN